MFKEISWRGYVEFIGITLIAYYLIVAWMMYRWELKKLWHEKLRLALVKPARVQKQEILFSANENTSDLPASDYQTIRDKANLLAQELQLIFQKQYSKEELKLA